MKVTPPCVQLWRMLTGSKWMIRACVRANYENDWTPFDNAPDWYVQRQCVLCRNKEPESRYYPIEQARWEWRRRKAARNAQRAMTKTLP